MLASFSIFFIIFARLRLAIEIHTAPAISFHIGGQNNSQLQSLGNWVTAGDAHFTNQKLSLVQGSDEDSYGKAFYYKMIHSQYFSIEMMLDLSDLKSMQNNQPPRYKTFEPRRGFAFWYLTDPLVINRINQFGEYYGLTRDYKGIGIFFYNRKMGEIIIHVQQNNGQPVELETPSKSSIENDNFCLIRLPHKEKSQIYIEFTPKELKVSAIVIGNRPRVCLSNPNFTIKQPGYIGLSASNLGISPQDISLTKFEFTNNDSNFDHSQHLISNIQPDKAILNSVVKKSTFSSTKSTIISQAKAKFLLPQGTAQVTKQVPTSQETPQSKLKVADQQAIDKALYQHQKQFSQIRLQEKKIAQHRIKNLSENKNKEILQQKKDKTPGKQIVDQSESKTIEIPNQKKHKATGQQIVDKSESKTKEISNQYKDKAPSKQIVDKSESKTKEISNQQKDKAPGKQIIDQNESKTQEIPSYQKLKAPGKQIVDQMDRKTKVHQQKLKRQGKQTVDQKQYKISPKQIQLQTYEKIQIKQQKLKQMDQMIFDQIKKLQQQQSSLIQKYQSTKALLQKYNNALKALKTPTDYLILGTNKRTDKFIENIKTLKRSYQFLKTMLDQIQIANIIQHKNSIEKQKVEQIFNLSQFWAFTLFILAIIAIWIFCKYCVNSIGSKGQKYHLP